MISMIYPRVLVILRAEAYTLVQTKIKPACMHNLEKQYSNEKQVWLFRQQEKLSSTPSRRPC